MLLSFHLPLSAHIYSAWYLSSFILQGHPRHPRMNNISSPPALKSCENQLSPLPPLSFQHPRLSYSSFNPSLLTSISPSCVQPPMHVSKPEICLHLSKCSWRKSLDTKTRSSIRGNLFFCS